MKKEILGFIHDRWTLGTTTFSISIPAVISIVSAISGKINILWLSLYSLVILFIGSNSLYILLAQEKVPVIEIPGKGYDGKSIAKYPRLVPYGWMGLAISVLLVPVFGLVSPFNQPVIITLYGTSTPPPTITPTPTCTPTDTTIPTFTFTSKPSPTPTLASDATYYMIVLDASEKMKESFHGQSKWDVALHSATTIIDGLDRHAKYGLVVIGGSNSSGLGDPCGDPSTLAVPFSDSETVRDHLNQLQPQGGGSFFTAYIAGKHQLEDLPPDAIRTLIFITGSSDTCEKNDEWADLERILHFSTSVEVYSEIIILDEKRGIETQSIAERLNSLSENVNVQAPQSIPALKQSSTTVINNVDIYVNNATIEIAADNAPNPAPISTPVAILTKIPTIGVINTPAKTATKTPAVLATFSSTSPPTVTNPPSPVLTATPTQTVTVPPTPTSTSPPLGWTAMPFQNDVFSLGCPLINHARVYAQFSQAQASISAAYVPGGRSNNVLRLDFFNASEAGGSYAGWEVWLGTDDQSGINLSSYNSLVFYVRGNVGGEEPNVYLMNPAIGENYQRYWRDIEKVTPITTSWQQVVIPLSYFTSGPTPNQQVNLSNVQRIQILFEWYPQPTSGRIYIDDLCVQ